MPFEKLTFEKAEQATKLLAAVVVIVYVLGFLTTSLYYSTLGIGLLNLWRPRIIGAGILLLTLSGAAYFAGFAGFRLPDGFNEISNHDKVAHVALSAGLTIFFCVALSISIFQMTDYEIRSSIDRLTNLQLIASLSAMVGIVVWRNHNIYISDSMRGAIAITGGLMPVLAVVLFTIGFRAHLEILALVVWLSGATLSLRIIGWLLRSKNFSSAINMVSVASQVVLYLTTFTHYIYPHFRPEWGGGAPVYVIVTFGKDANNLAGRVTPALLLDESDLGFYFLDRNLHHTYFVPRASVAMLDYPEPSAKR